MDSPAAGGPAAETVIAREVAAAIGAHAAAATPGVVRLEASVGGLLAGLGRTARQRIAGITPAPLTGTSATVADGQARLRVAVAVAGDQPALRTAAAVQRSVARAVTDGTGLLVAGVSVAILDIIPAGQWHGYRQELAAPAAAPAAAALARQWAAGTEPAASDTVPPAGSRSEASAAIVAAVRSVPGLRPASPVGLDRTRWMAWDPALLAVSLDGGYLEVQLAATRLPLPPLLERAAAAVREAAGPTRWGALPSRLVVAVLDAAALSEAAPTGGAGARSDLRRPAKLTSKERFSPLSVTNEPARCLRGQGDGTGQVVRGPIPPPA